LVYKEGETESRPRRGLALARPLRVYLKIAAVVIAIALIAGMQVGTRATIPTDAVVYADDGARTIVAPQCRAIWQRFSARRGAQLRKTVYSELQMRGYAPNKNCAQLGAFEQPGPTWSRLLFIKTGLIPEPRYWWDEGRK
jgi:hypothetical protein